MSVPTAVVTRPGPLTPAPAATPGGDSVVAGLRSRPDVVRLGHDGDPRVTVRVEMPEVWDVVRVETPPTEPVRHVKTAALAVLYPDAGNPDEFVVKLNGAEVTDESASLADAGARDGSTFLLTFRRRRPVRS